MEPNNNAARRERNSNCFFKWTSLLLVLVILWNSETFRLTNTARLMRPHEVSRVTKNHLDTNGDDDDSSLQAASSSRDDYEGSAWCPGAVCFNSDLCRPCHRRFLIVLATGRSASTTLTYMLDSLPGIRMSGENNDQLKAIRRMIDNVEKNENFQRNAGHRSAWGHNPVPAGAYSCVGQHMMETINPPATDDRGRIIDKDDSEQQTIVGFKTVRFLSDIAEDQMQDLVDWVQETFPCARFVVNIRSSVAEQAESWKKSFGASPARETMKVIVEKNRLMKKLANLLGDSAYLLDSSEWLKDIAHLNRAVEWMGFDKSCFFEELLEFNTKGGYGHGKTTPTTTNQNHNCRYVG